jgi:hypothetical protein
MRQQSRGRFAVKPGKRFENYSTLAGSVNRASSLASEGSGAV